MGYLIPFATGTIFKHNYTDPTVGMALNHMWIIGAAVYFFIICI